MEYIVNLMQEGVQSISLNPNSIVATWLALAKKLNVLACPA